MRSIRELVRLSTEFLEKKGVLHARRAAEELLATLLGQKRIELYFDYDAPLEEGAVAKYREWIRRKGNKEPLAYITGEVEFLGLSLKVSSETLIPRQETEILADLITKSLSESSYIVWDLCTGSGCLGLAVKNKCPNCSVVLSDISSKALAVARENAFSNALAVDIVEGDLLTPFAEQKCDVLICNPPYVTQKEYETLEDEVRLYEPRQALVGGIDFYERLAQELPGYLNPGAKIFFEIGACQGDVLHALFNQSHWKQKRCEKDWAAHDRFFFLEYHPESQ